MLVYTRWDYVDRDSDVAHHLWRCYPDGRDPRSPHGNYPDVRESRPWMEMSLRAVPGSANYVAVAAPHHGEAYGSLVLIESATPRQRPDSPDPADYARGPVPGGGIGSRRAAPRSRQARARGRSLWHALAIERGLLPLRVRPRPAELRPVFAG